MPARNPRINIVLERPLHEVVKRLARRDGVSLSSKVRDLVNQALEAEEDLALAALAEKRERTFDRAYRMVRDEVWIFAIRHRRKVYVEAERRA